MGRMDGYDIFLPIILAWLVALQLILVAYISTKVRIKVTVSVSPMRLAEIALVVMILAFLCMLFFKSETSFRS